MAGSNTCAGADSSLPDDFLEEISKLVVKNDGGAWQKRDRLNQKGVPTGNKSDPRTFLDDHDCCLVEDIGGPRCARGKCACGTVVPYDTDAKRHRPLKKNG
jgi:hypothetical protein